jgi:putative membrane protein
MMQSMGGMMSACLGGMGGIMTFMAVFWVAIIAAAIYAARQIWQGPQPATARNQADDTALVMLRERFARGEIDRPEYEERRRLLADEHRWP